MDDKVPFEIYAHLLTSGVGDTIITNSSRTKISKRMLYKIIVFNISIRKIK